MFESNKIIMFKIDWGTNVWIYGFKLMILICSLPLKELKIYLVLFFISF